jgi:hypothetical protein
MHNEIITVFTPWTSLTKASKLKIVEDITKKRTEEVAQKASKRRSKAVKKPKTNPFTSEAAKALFDKLPENMKGIL